MMEKNNETPKIINENHMENCNVFQGDVYGASFPLPGAQVTINQYYGKGQKPQQTTQGKVETAEAREQRKAEVMKAITDKFNFDSNMLGYDNKKNKITNERLACLFRKCFGMSYVPPTQQNRMIQEQLWVLLIDERNQCSKEPGEDFFRQTVLNIIGYFVAEGLIVGLKADITHAMFKDADDGVTKNIPRGISSKVFPEGLDDMLDHYIGKLMDGEF